MRSFLFVSLFLTAIYSIAQTTPNFLKYSIGNSGHTANFPSKPEEAELAYSPDSSEVYTMFSKLDEYEFGVITVNLHNTVLANDEKIDMLTSYLDYLKGSFKITSSKTYEQVYGLPSDSSVKGLKDTWKDEEGDDWVVNAWINSTGMAVMYIVGKPIYNDSSNANKFFKSYIFPGQ